MLYWLFFCCCFSILQTIQYIYTHYSDIFMIRAPDNFPVGGAISPYNPLQKKYWVWVQLSKTIKLVFAASLIRTQLYGVRTSTGCLWVQIKCLCWVTNKRCLKIYNTWLTKWWQYHKTRSYDHNTYMMMSFVLVLKKHPIRMPYQVNTSFWLEELWVRVWN
jgi:hypothetical protein